MAERRRRQSGPAAGDPRSTRRRGSRALSRPVVEGAAQSQAPLLSTVCRPAGSQTASGRIPAPEDRRATVRGTGAPSALPSPCLRQPPPGTGRQCRALSAHAPRTLVSGRTECRCGRTIFPGETKHSGQAVRHTGNVLSAGHSWSIRLSNANATARTQRQNYATGQEGRRQPGSNSVHSAVTCWVCRN